ncbi:MAG TPA: hypothetical protein VMB72_07745, partial [Acidimicrobiales bacterium]|nr:hypothetical protein [Acidimicrobiales bacterium]
MAESDVPPRSFGLRHLAHHLRRRGWPLVVTTVVVASGMAYSLLWGIVVRHHDYWVYPGDIWGAYRSAHYIGWGALGSVYAAGTGLVTFPGILVLFTPCAILTGHLGMTESFPYYVPHPTSWLVLGPYEMLLGCSVLFACDALAERLGVGRGRRALLCIAEGVAVWPLLAMWGHPEDAVATALAAYALVLACDNRWTGVGWLFGAAVVTQPLVLLALPVLLAWGGRERILGLVMRAALPSVGLLAVPLAAEFHVTVHALVDQPNFPGIDHVTPWTALAPRLGGHGRGTVVAAGPGRLVALVAASALGWGVRRWRHRPALLVWATAVAMSLRCLTESVMVAFYVWPALALALVISAHRGGMRLVLAVLVAAGVTVCAQTRLGEWPWWLMVNGGLLATIAVALWPRRSS